MFWMGLHSPSKSRLAVLKVLHGLQLSLDQHDAQMHSHSRSLITGTLPEPIGVIHATMHFTEVLPWKPSRNCNGCKAWQPGDARGIIGCLSWKTSTDYWLPAWLNSKQNVTLSAWNSLKPDYLQKALSCSELVHYLGQQGRPFWRCPQCCRFRIRHLERDHSRVMMKGIPVCLIFF